MNREDVITLQNPHGFASASVPKAASAEKATKVEKTKAVVAKASPAPPAPVAKAKGTVPCEYVAALL